ncbi:hypothetical protein AMECASPLE_039504 [Ameca splendens]|uniref:Uncharacterized protein n=1 Tax=Ameca splendens TaxID=208324 RepID=A0ABV0ZH83_9TELE
MHTLIHTPKGNSERPINLTGMSLDCGRKPEYPVRTHTCTGSTYKLHAERPHGRESNPGPSCCKATALPTATPCRPSICFTCFYFGNFLVSGSMVMQISLTAKLRENHGKGQKHKGSASVDRGMRFVSDIKLYESNLKR